MAIDVMLPYYGDVDQMKLAAQSVMNQQNQDWRLIVIDDGYPDPEPEHLKPLIQRLFTRD